MSEQKGTRLKEEGQEYGRVDRMIDRGKVTVDCEDGVKRMALIPGEVRYQLNVSTGHVVLLTLFPGTKSGAVIHKYTGKEVEELIKLGYVKPISTSGGDDEEEEFDV